MKQAIWSILLLTAAGLYGEEITGAINPADWTRSESGAGVAALGDDFEHGLDNWRIVDENGHDEIAIVPDEGLNGSHALRIRRLNPQHSSAAVWTLPELATGQAYRVSIHYRSSGSSQPRTAGPSLAVSQDGKFLFNIDPGLEQTAPTGPDEWRECTFEFEALPRARYDLRLLLFYGATGEIRYDYLTIEPVRDRAAFSLHLLQPCGLHRDDSGVATVKINRIGTTANKFAALKLIWSGGGRQWSFPIGTDGIARIGMDELPSAGTEWQAAVVDPTSRQILAEETFRIFPESTVAPPRQGRTGVDEHGRVLLDGKPFLPVGIYVTWLRTEDWLKRIADGGFNFITCYAGWDLNIQPELNETARRSPAGPLPDYGTARWFAATARSLDLIEANHLKIMPVVDPERLGELRRHPALLGYYLSDEAPRSQIPQLRKDRERISRLDPWHITVSLTCHPQDFVEYSKTGDILSIDCYPIGRRDSAHDMAKVRLFLDAAAETASPVWFVPQAFNWGAHQSGNYADFAYPTETEMRSMVLLAAIKGVKGFCFYDYSTIRELQEERDPGSAERFWPQVSSVAKLLRELAPWILSLEKAPELKVVSQTGAPTEVKALTAEGKTIVLVTSDGPGKGEIVFRVGNGRALVSRYGRTVRLPGGDYRFTGTDIDSDVLTEPQAEK